MTDSTTTALSGEERAVAELMERRWRDSEEIRGNLVKALTDARAKIEADGRQIEAMTAEGARLWGRYVRGYEEGFGHAPTLRREFVEAAMSHASLPDPKPAPAWTAEDEREDIAKGLEERARTADLAGCEGCHELADTYRAYAAVVRARRTPTQEPKP